MPNWHECKKSMDVSAKHGRDELTINRKKAGRNTMNTKESSRVWHIAKASFAIVMLLFASQSALAAATAANHIVRHTVTVNYQDLGANPFSAVDTIDVTIALVKAAPDAVLNGTLTDALNAVSPGDVVNVVYTVTSNANGEDEYGFENELILDVGVQAISIGPIFFLGATSAAVEITGVTVFETGDVAADAGTDISVPADSVNADGDLNGIALGDIIVLDMSVGGDNVCTVNRIADGSGGAEPNGVVIIEVDNCSQAGGTLSVGDQIGERKEIQSVVIIGANSNAGTVTVNMKVDYVGGVTPTEVNGTLITVVIADLQIYKYVRNITSAAGNATGNTCTSAFDCLNVGGTTYYSSGVTALPIEQLEYMVLLYNNAGDVQNVIVTDPFIIFTSYDPASIQVIADTTALDGTGTCAAGASGTCTVAGALSPTNADDTLVNGDDFGGVDDNGTGGDTSDDIITVYAGHDGTSANASETGTGGVIDAGAVSVVRYTVTISDMVAAPGVAS